MFEGQLTGLLKRILGDYVQDIDREALRLSVWKARPFFHLSICSALIAQLITRSLCPQGDVELHNIRLRPEAFITADLPVEVVAGTAAFVKLKVPWRHLGRQPVMVEMDRVYLLAREERLDGPSGQHTEDSDAALRSKQSQLDTQETEWLASRAGKKQEQASSGGGGMFGNLINTILGNIQLYISNVHVRMEGETFAAGMTLHRLSVTTVDEHGNESFSVGGLVNRLQKVARLQRLAVYMDHGSSQSQPKNESGQPTQWYLMKQELWDDIFQPGIANDSGALHRQYLLYPIDAKGLYERRGNKESRRDMEAVQHVSISFDRFMLSLSKQQYIDLQGTSNRIYTKKAWKALPYGDKRPLVSVRQQPWKWWQYAYEAIKQTRLKVKWSELIAASKARKSYVSIFGKKLQNSSSLAESDIKQLSDTERAFEAPVLFLWRKMAHLQAEHSKEEEASRWRFFGLRRPRSHAVQPSQQTDEYFSEEDMDKLKEVFQVEEAAPSTQETDPYALLTHVDVKMGFGAFYLTDQQKIVAQTSISNLSIGTKLYPSTSAFTVSVDSYIVKSNNESVVWNGRQLDQSSEARALSLGFVSKPQDNNADSRFSAEVAPCLVTARPEVMESLKSFFEVPKDVDNSAIAAAASNAAERARSAAASGFEQQISKQPSLELSLRIQAPKVALCTTSTNALLDLGSFSLWSASKTTYKMHGTGISVALFEEDTWSWNAYMSNGLAVRTVVTPVEIEGELTSSEANTAQGTALRVGLHLRGCEARASPMAIESLQYVANAFSAIGDSSASDTSYGLPWANPDFEHRGSCLFWTVLGTRGQWKSTYIAIADGKLYVTEEKSASKALKELKLSDLRLATQVHKDTAEDMENVVVLSNKIADIEDALRAQDSIILRFYEANTASQFLALVRRLTEGERSAADMHDDEEGQQQQPTGIESSTLELHVSVSDCGALFSDLHPDVDLSAVTQAQAEALEENLLRMRMHGMSLDASAKKGNIAASLKLQSFYVEDCLASRELDEQCFMLMSRTNKPEIEYLLDGDFQMASPDSTSHQGIDTQLRLELNELTISLMPRTTQKVVRCINNAQSAMNRGATSSSNEQCDEKVAETSRETSPEAAKVEYFFKRNSDQILLQLKLNVAGVHIVAWESSSVTFAVFAAERLDVRLTIHPDLMNLRCSLGDLMLEDHSLEPESAYRSFLRVVDQSPSSVLAWADVSRYNNPAAYGVNHDVAIAGRLSQTLVTFRYKFVEELQLYMGMLTEDVEQGEQEESHAAGERDKPQQDQKKQQGNTQQQQEALGLKLDVVFEAPYIIIPRTTGSSEALEIDFGHLKLESMIDDGHFEQSRVEVTDVSMTELALWVRTSSTRSKLNAPNSSILTQLQRTLTQTEERLPAISVDLRIPELALQLTSSQFDLLKSCATENMSESPRLPGRNARSTQRESGTDKNRELGQRNDKDIPLAWVQASIPLARISILQQISGTPTSLAVLELRDLVATVRTNDDGDLAIRANLPRFELTDAREGVKTAGEKIMKCGILNSDSRQDFLSMAYTNQKPGLAAETRSIVPNITEVNANVNEPGLTLETDFVLSVARFFVPGLAVGEDITGDDILPNDIFLSEKTKLPESPLELSTRRRLLGDAFCSSTVELDGQGGTVVLPSEDKQPVILLDSGQHLLFRNLTIQNSERLASAISLPPGASYSVESDDGVVLQFRDATALNNEGRRGTTKQAQEKSSSSETAGTWTIINIDVPGAELVATKIMDSSQEQKRVHFGILSSFRARMEQVPSGGKTIEAGVTGLRIDQYQSYEYRQKDYLKILSPCSVDCKLAQSASGWTDVEIVMSCIQAQFSVSTVQFIQSVASDAVVPIVARSPLALATRFKKIWSGDGADTIRGEEHNVSFWNPIPPPGYALLGSTATHGSHPPEKALMVIRDISALCSPPLSYRPIWSDRSGSVTIWWPKAPEGYRVLGSLACRGQDEPSKSATRCVRHELVRSCHDWETLGKTGLMFCYNRVQSIVPQESLDDEPGMQRVDLRAPHGISLSGASEPETEGATEPSMQTDLESTTVCDFKRLWTSLNTGAASEMSIWRPVPPSGFYSLGDIAVPGLQGPWQALAFSDNNNGALAQPLGFRRTWKDSGTYASSQAKRLSFWEPQAPDGYVAVGHVCNIASHDAPRAGTVMCVRRDLVVESKPSLDRSRIWAAKGARSKLGDDTLTIFAADPLAGTFISTLKSGGLVVPMLKGANQEDRTTGMHISAKCSEGSLLVHDDKSSERAMPVALLSLSEISSESAQLPASSKSKLHGTLSVSIFNSRSGAYEPVVEGFNVSVGQQAISSGSPMLQPTGSRLSVMLQQAADKRMRVTLSKSGMNEVINKCVDSMKHLGYGKGSNEELQEHRSGRINSIAQEAGERRADLPGRKGQASTGGSAFENRTGMSVALLGSAVRMREVELEPYTSVELDPANDVTANLSGKGPHGTVNQESENALESYMALKIHAVYGIPKGFTLWPLRLLVSLGEKSFGRTATKRVNDEGSFSVDEQILLRIEGESHKHLTISVIEETATLHGSCLATGTLSGDWTSTPTYGSDFQMQATNNVTIECNVWSPSKQTAGMQQLQTPGSSPAEPLVMQSTDRRASSASSVATMDGEHYLMMRTEISSKYFVLPKAISRSIATTFAVTFDETTSLVMERYGGSIVARAPLRVSNTTLYPLLVGLHETSNSRSRPVIEREVFENERFQPARSWGSSQPGHLLPTDPSRYSDRKRQNSTQEWPHIPPPPGYEWEDSWQIDVSVPGIDKHGWTYGSDFRALRWPPPPNCNKPTPLHHVRRRRWRKRAVISGSASTGDLAEPDLIVGKVDPGFELCMPHKALEQQHRYDICFKPEGASGWSNATIFPWCTEVLNMRSDVHALPGRQSSSDPLQEKRFLSISSRAESVQFVGSLKGNMLTDWTVTIATPLTIQNRLPLEMSITVMQHDDVTTFTAPAGSLMSLHGVHPGKPIHLNLRSSDGHLESDGEAVPLQPGNKVVLKNSSGFRTNVAMDVTTSVNVRGEAMPINLQLYVPAWITNRTPLVLAATRATQPKQHSRRDDKENDHKSDEASESADSDSVEYLPTPAGSDGLLSSEFSIAGGSTVMLDGRTGAIFIRVLGSGYSPPLELVASDKVTVIQARTRDGSVAPVAISQEHGSGGFEHSISVTIEPHVKITNRTKFALDFCQANTDFPRPASLPAGENAKPIVWEDAEAPEALTFRLAGNSEASWSHAVYPDELGEAFLTFEDKDGLGEFLQVSREQFSSGGFEVVLREVGSSPPFCCENKTERSLQCLVGSSSDQWLEIQPRSCRALIPKMMQQGESLELILAENVSINDVPQSTFYLEQMADAKSHTGRGEMKMHDGVTKQVRSYTSDSTTALVIGEQIKAEHSSEAYPKRRSESVIDMRIRNLEISLVDGMPMEVLLLSIDEMALFTANGVSDGSSSALILNVKSIQLDDQVAYSQVPVVVSHQGTGTPLLDCRLVSQGFVGNTTILSRIGLTTTNERLNIGLHEPLLWKLLDLIEGLQTNRLLELQQEALADPQLAIKELALLEPAMRLGITFKTEGSGRPKKVSQLGAALFLARRFGLTFANISNGPLKFRPIRLRQLTVSQSALVRKLLQRLSKQTVSQAISLLTGVGILDSTSKAFGQASSILGWVRCKSYMEETRAPVTAGEEEESEQHQVNSLQRGLFEGGKSAVGGVFRGVCGVFEKPVKGAEHGGTAGFFKGLGQGVIGAAANPVAGALKTVSNVTEGVSSTVDSGARLMFGKSSRRTLPLAIKGDGVIRSYNDSEAFGQHVLRIAQADTLGFGGGFDFAGLFSSRGSSALDKYESHVELPKEKILVYSSERMVMLQKPSVNANLLERACNVRWEVHWEEVQRLEHRGKQGTEADCVTVVFEQIVTRQPLFDSGKTAHTIKCGTRQKALALKEEMERLRAEFSDNVEAWG